MSNILLNNLTIGFKRETVPYQAEDLSSIDYHYSINSDIKIETNIENYFQNICTGDFSKFPVITGKKICAVNFSIDLYTMDDLTTSPSYFDIIESCGWKKLSISNGIKILKDSLQNRNSSTIEVVLPEEGNEPKQTVYKISGAMGMVKFKGETGKCIKAEFSFIGSLNSITTRSFDDIIIPESFDDAKPFVLLNSSFRLFNTDFIIDKFEINSGEIISIFTNIMNKSGYDGARIIESYINGKVNLYEDTDSLNILFNKITNNNEGSLLLVSNNLTFNITNLKIIAANDKLTEIDFEGIKGFSIQQKEPSLPCSYTCYYILTNCTSGTEIYCKEILELGFYGTRIIADFSNGWMNLKWLVAPFDFIVISSDVKSPIQSLPAGNWGYSMNINFDENGYYNPSSIYFGIYNGVEFVHGFKFNFYYYANRLVVQLYMNKSIILTLDRNNQNDMDHRITFIKIDSSYYAFIDDLELTGSYDSGSDSLILNEKFQLRGYGGYSGSYQSEVNIKEIVVISPYESNQCSGELSYICGVEQT